MTIPGDSPATIDPTGPLKKFGAERFGPEGSQRGEPSVPVRSQATLLHGCHQDLALRTVPSFRTPTTMRPPSRFSNAATSLARRVASASSQVNSTRWLEPFRMSSSSSVLVIILSPSCLCPVHDSLPAATFRSASLAIRDICRQPCRGRAFGKEPCRPSSFCTSDLFLRCTSH